MRELSLQPGPGDPNNYLDIDEWLVSLKLGPDAMAWDIGVHEAHCIRHLVQVYPCHFYGFEPQATLYDPAVEEFKHYPNVRLFPFALGEKSGRFPMCFDGSDRCSFIGGVATEGSFMGDMVDVAEFMEQENIQEVDFCMVNCEGYEVILIPYLAKRGLLERFRNLMIQWHLSWEGAPARRNAAIRALQVQHTLRIDKDRAWQIWERNP